jgi:DNA-binding response OmpR family regulator
MVFCGRVHKEMQMIDGAQGQEKPEKKLIVVIDDDYDVLEWCRVVLEMDDFAVECFFDPEKAYGFMLDHKPGIILSDLMMAHLDSGFDFAQRIKETPALKDIPIIIMTAASSRHGFDFSPQTESDLKTMKIDAYFAKPADPKALLSKIHELISR